MFQRMFRIASLVAAVSLSSFAVTAVSATVAPSQAAAQGTTADDVVQQRSGNKGLFSLGILGAELGLVIPAAAGLDEWWALVVFPAVGAAGGAVAGHYLLDNNNQTKASTAILAISIALVVPSVVLTMALRAYSPGDDGVERIDNDPLPGEEDDEAAEAAALRRQQSLARAGSGLLRVSEYGLHLGLPSVEVAGLYSDFDLARSGAGQQTQVTFSLFSGVF